MDHLALAGHAGAFPVTQAAKNLILEYLDEARVAAVADPDRDEIVRDIEIAIGDNLQSTIDGGITLDERAVARILEQFGPIDAGEEAPNDGKAPFLCRIDEGKAISGICLGLATRAELRVDWLRTIAFFLLLLTGGLLGLAYLIALLFVPRMATVRDYQDALARDRARTRIR